jgi:hypothetical protein
VATVLLLVAYATAWTESSVKGCHRRSHRCGIYASHVLLQGQPAHVSHIPLHCRLLISNVSSNREECGVLRA